MRESVYATLTGVNAWNGDGMVGLKSHGPETHYKFNESLTRVQLQ